MTASATPPKLRPTNADLQDQIAEAHDCIHNVGERVDELAKVVEQDRNASKRRDEKLDARLEAIEKATKDKTVVLDALSGQMGATDARVELLVKFFGLRTPQAGEEPRRRVTLGSLEWWQAVLGICGSVIAALGAWKYLFPALVALHHALLAAH
jgi:hypothetical protein